MQEHALVKSAHQLVDRLYLLRTKVKGRNLVTEGVTSSIFSATISQHTVRQDRAVQNERRVETSEHEAKEDKEQICEARNLCHKRNQIKNDTLSDVHDIAEAQTALREKFLIVVRFVNTEALDGQVEPVTCDLLFEGAL